MKKTISFMLLLFLASCEMGGATAGDYWSGGQTIEPVQQMECE